MVNLAMFRIIRDETTPAGTWQTLQLAVAQRSAALMRGTAAGLRVVVVVVVVTVESSFLVTARRFRSRNRARILWVPLPTIPVEDRFTVSAESPIATVVSVDV